ncbi:hypothetical protein N7541_004123 [Penicillium brevicompactum]|uniref:Uncharacterized protein n=1 Tax=Penicillium brevicompactum TaxID=5074 RepID=A0A9W9V0I8_PENBR|nr:hypothetical protein N7541_004123 [Penicillium brevicompactum]
MSTQSPRPPTPKGSRNTRKSQKKNMTPQSQKPGLSTPPSSPPGNISGGIHTDSSNNFNSTKKKQAPRSVKKPRDANSPATHNGYYNGNQNNGYSNGYRSTPNHASMKESAAYAGPTFHASPAPSSLPMPKFLPKSAPDADLVPPLETDSDSADLSPEPETTPSKHRSRYSPVRQEPKPTALDFMFQAAKQAQENKATSSPDVSRTFRSPQTEPAARYHPSGMYASDMGNDHARSSPIGPSFAPSYQERMAALRPSSMPQSPEVSDAERKAKTEQLKDLLLNPRPQKPPSKAPFSPVYGNADIRQSPSFDRAYPNIDNHAPGTFHPYSGNHDPRPSNVHPFATPSRAASGPPMMYQNPFGHPPPQPNPHLRNPYLYPGTNSPLRGGVLPPSMPHYQARGAVSNGSSPGPYPNQHHQSPNHSAHWQGYVSPQPAYSATAFQPPTHSPSPLPSQATDTQQIENDIRRVLKLDASSTVA